MKVSIFKSASGGQSPPIARNGQSIRGKISAPIPIADDEFPIRNPGTGIATPLDEKEEQLLPRESIAISDTTPSRHKGSPNASSSTGSSAMAYGSPQGGAPTTAAAATGSPQSQRRTNPPSTLRHSVLSEGTENTTDSKDMPQRKQSTFRGAFSKLFGRKKKNASISTTSHRASTLASPPQPQNGSPVLNRGQSREDELKRSASVPISEYDRALRSHSIGPNDICAIESARNSMHADLSLSKKRATTATSHLFRGRDSYFTGLSPRPASTHARGSMLLSRDDGPDEIGRAISIDAVGLKRRSRSLGGLDDIADNRAEVRRRSDEIRYWRESYDPALLSPISSNMPDHDKLETAPASPEARRRSEDVQTPPKTPPQPFNFANMTHLHEMAGMKITQAASLETRVDGLETRMRRLEKVVAHLCSSPSRYTAVLGQSDPATKEALTKEAGKSATSDQTASNAVRDFAQNSSSMHSRNSQDSLRGALTNGHASQTDALLDKNRAASDSTVREQVALDLLSLQQNDNAELTTDRYSTLLALLKTERASRQSLEAQVQTLTQQMQSLISGQAIPPPTTRFHGVASAFDHEDSEDDSHSGTRDRTFRVEDSGIATGGTGASGDDDNYSENFATPREDVPQGYGYYDEELSDNDDDRDEDDDEAKRRKAARTLSLSQLTMGKPHAKAVI